MPSRIRLKKITIILLIPILTWGILFYYRHDPSQYDFMPRCVVKLTTGLDCPGCGFQRALHALLHGHVRESIGFNPFLIISLPILLTACITEYISCHISKPEQLARITTINNYLVYSYIALYLIWFVIRNIFFRSA